MDIIDILIGFVLNGVVILIFRSILEAAHDRDIARIESEHQKALAHLNAQLDKSIKIQLTQFASLHERRAHVIAELYKLLAQAESKLEYVHLPTPKFLDDEEMSWQDRVINRMRPTTEAVDTLITFYNENKIFLTPSVVSEMDRIASIVEGLYWSARARDEMQRELPFKDEDEKMSINNYVEDRLSKAFATFNKVYPQIKHELEAEFRTILGFDIENPQPNATNNR